MGLVLRREVIAAQKAGVDLPEEESPAIQDELLMLLVAVCNLLIDQWSQTREGRSCVSNYEHVPSRVTKQQRQL